MESNDNWRLILNAPNSGAWNMAVDEALLESTSSHEQPPTLRLYDWRPFTLSLGIAQPAGDVDIEELNKRNWDLVRRPTGGRAILHADELTYSITAPIENPILHGSVIESYRRISSALVRALEIVGLCTDSKPKNKEESYLSNNPVCFQFPSDYEITYEGKKIVGSAQARKKGGILQHGSIPLYGEIARIIDVLDFPEASSKQAAKSDLQNRATSLFESLGKIITWTQFAEAMAEGFANQLNIQFHDGKLSRKEIIRAESLFREKYFSKDWTFRI